MNAGNRLRVLCGSSNFASFAVKGERSSTGRHRIITVPLRGKILASGDRKAPCFLKEVLNGALYLITFNKLIPSLEGAGVG
jgi:hypothetical protein